MSTMRARFLSTMVLSLGVPGIFLGVAAPTATADDGVTEAAADYGGGCVLDPDNRAITIDSLRFRCTPEQQDAIFRDAERGAVPMGVKNGWVTRPPTMQGVAPAFWIGKTFYTGPDGGYLMNRVTGAGYEAWPANVYTAPALLDGRPTWALNYDPSPTPPVYDEIREITPGVWFGYSWWRGAFQHTMLLTFVLA
ncbi:hypothetical protein [Nocardia sp. NPDC052316]|uniref:hypothetical protein n=1 Tax=Nocardia sp. NPDC052316 TaxID=3364329 RepID=UPI0037CC83AD